MQCGCSYGHSVYCINEACLCWCMLWHEGHGRFWTPAEPINQWRWWWHKPRGMPHTYIDAYVNSYVDYMQLFKLIWSRITTSIILSEARLASNVSYMEAQQEEDFCVIPLQKQCKESQASPVKVIISLLFYIDVRTMINYALEISART